MSIFTDQVVIQNTPLPVDGSGVTQPVSGTVVANAGTGTFQVAGSVTTTPVVSNSATISQITSNAANQTLLAANANRKKAVLFFNSGIWFVKFGATASSTSFTYNVTTSNTTLEVPIWVGQIDALCTTSGKIVTITELV